MSIIKMETEQIINKDIVKKQKDPKKVAAGKALAKKNAEARKVSKNVEDNSSASFSDINDGIIKAAGLVGAGFTLYHGWKFYESYRKPTTPKLEASTPEPPKKKSLRKSVDF